MPVIEQDGHVIVRGIADRGVGAVHAVEVGDGDSARLSPDGRLDDLVFHTVAVVEQEDQVARLVGGLAQLCDGDVVVLASGEIVGFNIGRLADRRDLDRRIEIEPAVEEKDSDGAAVRAAIIVQTGTNS